MSPDPALLRAGQRHDFDRRHRDRPRDAPNPSQEHRHRRAGFFLYGGTIKENIAYGNLEASDEQIYEAARRANIHEFVQTLPNCYDTEVGERGVKLSGGQKQRVSIARAFLKNPPVLILDEATSALDNFTEMQIQASLAELSAGRTAIVVAHRLSTVKNADEIILLRGGQIAERGTHEELMALNGEYAALQRSQFRS